MSKKKESEKKVFGYLPNDRLPFGKALILGLQHVLTMFPATVLVALLVGFHVNTVLLASGLATLVALLLSKWQIGKFIPLYYGSSFSYIAAILAITNANLGEVVADDLIRITQAGIVTTGFVNVVIGFLIAKLAGNKLEKINLTFSKAAIGLCSQK